MNEIMKEIHDNERVGILEWFIEIEVDQMEDEARYFSNMFWEHREELIEVRAKRSVPPLGCRVIRDKRSSSVSIVWFYHKFYPTLDGKIRRTNVHIKKPNRGNAYSLTSLLRYASPAQIDIISLCEERFALIRARMEYLRKMKHQLHYYKKSLGLGLGFDDEIDFKRENSIEVRKIMERILRGWRT